MVALSNILTSPEVITALATIIASLGLALGKRAESVIEARTNIEIEEKDMRVLHSALKSGAKAALRKRPSDSFDSLLDFAKKHALSSAADAIRRLQPDDETFDNLAGAAMEDEVDVKKQREDADKRRAQGA